MILDRGFDAAQLSRHADDVLGVEEADAKIAKATKDAAAIKLTAGRLATTKQRIASAASALAELEALDSQHGAAAGRTRAAQYAVDAGTLDAVKAEKNVRELTVTIAAERHHANLHPAACRAVQQPLNEILNSTSDADGRARGDVFAATRSYIATLFSSYSRGEADDRATKHGRASTTAQSAWWPVAEEVTRREFLPLQAEARRLFDKGRGDEPPTVDDLERCFVARRAGLEFARNAARSTSAALETSIGVSR